MKTNILKIRRENANLCKQVNGLTAVIVSTTQTERTETGILKRTWTGIQYWSTELLKRGYDKNTDGSISNFLGYL
jgi:hypothetical protein